MERNSNGYNLKSYEKFDEALKIIDSLDSCDISNAMKYFGKSEPLSKDYLEISDEIVDVKNQIDRLADGDGPEKLIQNYKLGYENIKKGIIEGYIAEYKFALESGEIKLDGINLSEFGEEVEEDFKKSLNIILSNLTIKNNSTNPNTKYSSLGEFFKDIENFYNSYTEALNEKRDILDVFGRDVTYISGYEGPSDVMPYTYLKPSSKNDGKPKPLIVWLHGGGSKGLKTFSESNYNLTHVVSSSELKNFDAYVISPVLYGDYYSSLWCQEKPAENLAKLLDKFTSENNVDKDNIIICGGSMGGQGTIYMAANMTEYFSKAVVLSGYPVKGINGADIQMPIKGYVGKYDDPNSIKYMNRLGKEIGQENITYVAASHGNLPRILYNTDSDGNGKSDFIEEIFSNSSHVPNLEQNLDSTPTTPSTPSTSVKPTTPSTPSTPVKPTTPSTPSTPVKPTTPSTPSTSVKPTTPSTPSTPVKPTTPSTPSTPVKPTTPSTPSTPSKPSTPSTPSTPSKPSTPSTPSKPSTPISNILPNNKFSDELPSISDGMLGAMEISNSSVSYNILNVNEEVYDKYLDLLEEQGYVLNENGFYSNGKYQVLASFDTDGSMNISLKALDK